MTEPQQAPQSEGRDDESGGRRLSIILYLTATVMITAAAAVLPLVADAHRASGLWLTFCAAIGLK